MQFDDNDLEWHNKLPHVRWTPFLKKFNAVTIDAKKEIVISAVGQWLQRLAKVLGREAGVLHRDEMYLLYSRADDQAERLIQWSANALKRIISIVGEHRRPSMVGPRVVLLFSDHERYYDYIDYYYGVGAGELGSSAGICISTGYMHVVVGPGEYRTRQNILAHELTHLSLVPLQIPPWLDEGLAQLMEEIVQGVRRFHIDREMVQRHKDFWTTERMQRFWSGDGFHSPDEMQELSYHLAEVLTRNILSDHRKSFIAFVGAAHRLDAGDHAAREVLGINLAQIAACFLGPGNWGPELAASA